jgi:3-oxoacyl-[acyl-carrier protein] reductase
VTTRSAVLGFSGDGAVVTGAASGIGAAVSGALVRAGIHTLAVDVKWTAEVHDPDLLMRDTVDVRDGEALRDAVRRAFPDGRVHYVVNCAGIPAHTGFRGVDRGQWHSVLDVNLVGAYNVIDATADLLVENDPAAIVNITSMEAHRVIALTNPDPNPHYAASKAALTMLTRTAARALGPRVRVNSVAPGFVATPMASEHGDQTRLPPPLAARTVAQRWARPSEIASAALFLLSDQAGFITGTDIVVDGGLALT